MATLYITEFANPANFNGTIAIPATPANTTQTVAIGGTSTQSAAFAQNTRYVRIHTDAICSILFGANPTATAAHSRMSANQTEHYAVTPATKIAVITNT